MNIAAAYINTAMPSCGGRRVFVPPGYGYNASERMILADQSKTVRDCYWLMAQEQNLEWESLGDRLHVRHALAPGCSQHASRWEPRVSKNKFLLPIYRM